MPSEPQGKLPLKDLLTISIQPSDEKTTVEIKDESVYYVCKKGLRLQVKGFGLERRGLTGPL